MGFNSDTQQYFLQSRLNGQLQVEMPQAIIKTEKITLCSCWQFFYLAANVDFMKLDQLMHFTMVFQMISQTGEMHKKSSRRAEKGCASESTRL